jgi:hypothetical protein
MKILGLFFYILVLIMPAQVSLASSKTNSTLKIGGRVPFKTSLEYRARPTVKLNVHRESDYYIDQKVVKNSSSNISYKYVVIGRN